MLHVGGNKADAEKLLTELGIDRLKTQYANSEIMGEVGLMGLPATVVSVNRSLFLGLGQIKDEQALSQWLMCIKTAQ